MAEYYTQFSFAINHLNADEIVWAEKLQEFLGRDPDDDIETEPEFEGIIEDDCYASVAVDIEDDIGGDYGLWVWSGDYGGGSPDEAALLVQKFLARFRPTEVVAFEWANSCSKPRLDSFGGGAVVISATNIEWNSTSQWVYDMTRKLTEQRPDSEQ